ncbi:hypothetical protein ACIO3O_21185 [Streptomyces sp. NPDC087440]|uniref:hypothetical protein n=1 Tax=Streptomyces sp. NPDC087440 TaxID=3365790 RepID=UPI00382C2A0B
MSGIGPVEPGGGEDSPWFTPPPAPGHVRPYETLVHTAGDRERPWHRALRRTALAAGALLALVVALGQPPSREPEVIPVPGLITRIDYQGPAGPVDTRSRSFAFRIRFHLDDGAPDKPLVIENIRPPYTGFTLHANPSPPLTVRPGQDHRTVLRITVQSCDRVPRNASHPLFDITVSNGRAEQRIGYAFGTAYAEYLEQALTLLCPRSVPRSPQAP